MSLDGIFHSKTALGGSQIQIPTSGAEKLMEVFPSLTTLMATLIVQAVFEAIRINIDQFVCANHKANWIATEAIPSLVRLQAGIVCTCISVNADAETSSTIH